MLRQRQEGLSAQQARQPRQEQLAREITALELTLPDENLPWIRGGVFARECMDLLERIEKK